MSSLYTAEGLSKLAEVVQQARWQKGWTQTQVAKYCGVGVATVSRLEAGDTTRTPTDVTLEKISGFIGLSRDELKAIAEERKDEDFSLRNLATELNSISSLSESQLDLVQATLGHSSIATTSRYLHARPSDSSALYLPT